MKTSFFSSPSQEDLQKCGVILSQGGLVAFPTETVYGLGANALSEEACKKIYLAKGRPSDNPLIVHIASQKDVELIAQNIPQKAFELMSAFWPGPLTLVLQKLPHINDIVTGGLGSIAVRFPKNEIAQKLILFSNLPIAAPSANISGKPSPTNAFHVQEDLDGKIDAILDGGETSVGIESTVLDMTTEIPVLLRPGSITKTQIETIIGSISYFVDEGNNIVAKSPGMKYKHYSPNCSIVWVENENFSQEIEFFLKNHQNAKILTTHSNSHYDNPYTFIGSSAGEVSKHLFSEFRKADVEKMSYLIIEPLGKGDDWEGVRNRLQKAASVFIK